MGAVVNCGSPFQNWGIHSLRCQNVLVVFDDPPWRELLCPYKFIPILWWQSRSSSNRSKQGYKCPTHLLQDEVNLKSHLIFRAPVRWAKDFAANALQFKSFLCPASFPYTYWSQKHSPFKFLHTSLSFYFFYHGHWPKAIISYMPDIRLQRGVEEDTVYQRSYKMIYQNRL